MPRGSSSTVRFLWQNRKNCSSASRAAVRSVNVQSGDLVAEGSLIAEIDTRNLAFDLEEAALTLALAEQRLKSADEVHAYDLQDARLELEIAQLQLKAYESCEEPDPAELEIRRR